MTEQSGSPVWVCLRGTRPYPRQTLSLLAAPIETALPVATMQTSHGPAWIVRTAREIPEEVRQRAFAGQCKDLRYYELVEETLPGQFDFAYLGLENAATGAVVVQPLFYVNQDLLAGLPARAHAWVEMVRRRWPRLLVMRMLMVGCASGEGHLDSAVPWVAEALHEALDLFTPECDASIILLKDFPARYRETLAPFSSNGYQRVPSMPGARLKLDFVSFEEFLQHRLSKVFRKNLRRKFRVLDGAPAVSMEVLSDVSHLGEELHALYMQTHLRSRMRFERLTAEYFVEAGRRMPDRVRFFVWRQAGRIIAFNFCMVHDDTLYDLEVGMDYAVALDLHLYFLTWRNLIEWALENGIAHYHTGPLNYDPKLHLRLLLAPQDLYARHVSRWINPVFKLAMHYLQPARHDPVIKRFPNAHEL
jgi:hypothetical protein